MAELTDVLGGRGGRIATYLGVVATGGAIGVAFAPAIFEYEPLLLVALSPLGRHLLLVAGTTALAPVVAVGTARRLLGCHIGYLIGREFGDRGLQWLKNRWRRLGGLAHRLRAWAQHNPRLAPLLLVVAPAPPVCAVAGAAGMPLRAFLPAAALGQALWVGGTYLVGAALSDWIQPIADFIRDHVLATTLASIAIVLGVRWVRRARLAQKDPA